MGDVSSGMASTVIKLYLKEILESFLHPDVGVRQAALKVIQLILQQGLVHPVQVRFRQCECLVLQTSGMHAEY
jgi:cohesin loading factor subunit SCC2